MKPSTAIAALALAVLAAAASHAAAAQRQGIGGRFPDVARVEADYPDDAERFIAFDILFNRLGEATRGAQIRTDYELASAYLRARGEVLAKYEQQGRGSETYKAFTARSEALFSDPSFKRSVFEKYQLTSLSASGPTSRESIGAALFPERTGDRSDAEIKAAFFEAFPVWGVATLGMIGLAWVLMRSAGDKPVKAPPRRDWPGALPQLPDNLRTVSVAGRRYDVVTASGQVIDKDSGVGVVWVRTPDRRETTWTLFGGVFQTRQGHVVSTIGRPLPDGTSDVLVAYNHTTDQLEMFPGVYAVHATRFLLPWFIVALAGSIPGAFGLGLMFHRLGGLSAPLVIALLTLWIMGGIASAVIAAFVALRMKRRVETLRTEKFVSDYLPEYRGFFLESTPALTRHFANT